MHVGAELDQRVGQVRAHEAVGAGDQHGPPAVGVAELARSSSSAASVQAVSVIVRTLRRSVSKRTASSGLGSLGSGAVTGLALAVQTGLGGRRRRRSSRASSGATAETDGFFAAYARLRRRSCWPRTRSASSCCLRSRVRARRAPARRARSPRTRSRSRRWPCRCSSLAVALPRRTRRGLLTGTASTRPRRGRRDVLPWMVLAAAAAALRRSGGERARGARRLRHGRRGLRARERRRPRVIVAARRRARHRRVAWGMALNGAIALGVPVAALALRARAASDARRGAAGRRRSRQARRCSGRASRYRSRSGDLPRSASRSPAARAPAGRRVQLRVPDRVGARGGHGLVARPRHVGPADARGLTPRAVARHVVASSWLLLASARPPACSRWRVRCCAKLVLGSSYGGEHGHRARPPRRVPRGPGWSRRSRSRSPSRSCSSAGGRAWLPLLALAAALGAGARRVGQVVGFGLAGVAAGWR